MVRLRRRIGQIAVVWFSQQALLTALFNLPHLRHLSPFIVRVRDCVTRAHSSNKQSSLITPSFPPSNLSAFPPTHSNPLYSHHIRPLASNLPPPQTGGV
ncbi:hypothetical protein BLNAU_9247 [Blattamonas nauphoetae]|uniref:Secreted protein n=1 Tax=Blattamonas nauphoetae TaxID=2049346 RepID=A0ABQ9XWP4_9EUKA|nr:hypothetical protein BLNAU_9247 [Blattamonas nauphoetae]